MLIYIFIYVAACTEFGFETFTLPNSDDQALEWPTETARCLLYFPPNFLRYTHIQGLSHHYLITKAYVKICCWYDLVYLCVITKAFCTKRSLQIEIKTFYVCSWIRFWIIINCATFIEQIFIDADWRIHFCDKWLVSLIFSLKLICCFPVF